MYLFYSNFKNSCIICIYIKNDFFCEVIIVYWSWEINENVLYQEYDDTLIHTYLLNLMKHLELACCKIYAAPIVEPTHPEAPPNKVPSNGIYDREYRHQHEQVFPSNRITIDFINLFWATLDLHWGFFQQKW